MKRGRLNWRPQYANATYLPPTRDTVVLYDLRHYGET